MIGGALVSVGLLSLVVGRAWEEAAVAEAAEKEVAWQAQCAQVGGVALSYHAEAAPVR